MKKFIYPILCLISEIYSVCYAGIGGFRGNTGALSKIGLSHPVLFAIWGITTFAVLALGIIQGYRKTKYKFYLWLLGVSFIGILLTVSCDFDYDKRAQYVLHCIGSLTFSAVMGITVFLLFLLSKSYILAAVSGVVLIADLVLLLIFKETAIIELTPIFTGYILMCIHNFKKEKILVGTYGQT